MASSSGLQHRVWLSAYRGNGAGRFYVTVGSAVLAEFEWYEKFAALFGWEIAELVQGSPDARPGGPGVRIDCLLTVREEV